MADVYLAVVEGPKGSGFTKLAVVKLLKRHLVDDPDFVAMMMDEARVTARLSHPNVVDLFEVGASDGNHFLAMEFLEGQPLNRVARRIERAVEDGADIPAEVTYAVVSDVLAGLHHAHELADYDGTPLEIVHRDVTPHNVFITYEGVVKVVDFGIAKAAGRRTQTEHGVVKGKVRYMSPEQATCGEVDRRTDIFAAGVMLWNLATGSKLWADHEDVGVVRALRAGDYPSAPRALFPDVPVEIDAICRKALAPRPADRYATADAMRADLEAFLESRGGDVRTKLASTMKEIFAKERAKLRDVLQASSLMSAPSVEVLAARARPTPPRARRASGPSLAPVSVAPARNGSAPRRGGAASASSPARGTSRSTAWTFALAALAVLFAIAARTTVFSGARDRDVVRRPAAIPAADLSPLARDVRAKAVEPLTVAFVPSPRLPGPRRSSAQSPAPSGMSVAGTVGSTKVLSLRRGTTIDATDPWSGKP
jgi:serine/threonine-protein kinase